MPVFLGIFHSIPLKPDVMIMRNNPGFFCIRKKYEASCNKTNYMNIMRVRRVITKIKVLVMTTSTNLTATFNRKMTLNWNLEPNELEPTDGSTQRGRG